MQTIQQWHWWITDPNSGLQVMSAHPMTAAQALAHDASAQPVYGTLQQHTVLPNNDAGEEWARQA